MAYLFQGGTQAIMSGSLIQEGAGSFASLDAGAGGLANAGAIAGATTVTATGLGDFGSLTIDNASTLGAGTDADMLTFDQGDKITVAADLNFVISAGKLEIGDGNAVTSTAAELNLVDSFANAATAFAADSIVFYDATDSKFKSETFAAYGTAIAGDGLNSSTGVLSVNVSGGVHLTGDKVAITGSIAGEGLKYNGGVDSISSIRLNLAGLAAGSGIQADDELAGYQSNGDNITYSTTDIAAKFAGAGLAAASAVMTIDLSEYSEVAPASNDAFLTLDSDNSTEQLCTVDALASLYAGAGMAATSGVIAVVNATNGGLSVGGSSMKLDFSDLEAVAVDVANDSLGYNDATDSGTKRTTIALLATAMAGTGISATNGVFSVDAVSAPNAIGDAAATLVEGFNYGNTTLTADRIWTLPAAPTVGDVIRVKAPDDVGAFKIEIKNAGSQTIDGSTDSQYLESDKGQVNLCYVLADTWKLF